MLYDLLKSFAREALSAIKWIGQAAPDEDLILGDLSVMAKEIFEGKENSLSVNEHR